MVHFFTAFNGYYCLDVPSGGFVSVDKLTYLLLKKRAAAPRKTFGELFCYSQAEIAEAEAEIEQLIADGLIFTAERARAAPEYDGVIKALCLNVTHDCNLACKYCFAGGGAYRGKREIMSAETAKSAVDFLLKHSGKRCNLEVDFFGGEPLLNFGAVKECVLYARQKEKEFGKNIRFTMTTNCTVCTDEIAEFVNSEISNLVLSIDGRAEVHNLMRPYRAGHASHDTTIKNARIFLRGRGGKSYHIRGTYTARNLDFASDVLALNDKGFENISLEPVVLEGGNPLALDKSMTGRIAAEYARLAGLYYNRRRKGKKINFFHFLIDLDGGPCEKKRLTGCGAGLEYAAVSPDGSLYPCHQFIGQDGFVMGNVRDGITDKSVAEKFLRSNVCHKPECLSCWAQNYCSGGCVANSHILEGDMLKPVDYLCRIQKARIECALAVKAMESLGNRQG